MGWFQGTGSGRCPAGELPLIARQATRELANALKRAQASAKRAATPMASRAAIRVCSAFTSSLLSQGRRS